MKRVMVLIGVMLGLVVATLAAPDDAAEFARRREAFLRLLDSSSAAVLKSAEPRTRSNDVAYRYRQEANLLYLTGVNRPQITLLMAPGGIRLGDSAYQVLLFQSGARVDSTWSAAAGADVKVLDAGQFNEVFSALLPKVRTLYLSPLEPAFVNDWLNGKPMFLERDARRRFEEEHPGLKTKNVGPLLSTLRQRKSPWELEKIRRAIACTGDGLVKAATVCGPDRFEYELQAAVEYEMIRQGADYTAYPSIVGSGPNSLILHYDDNRRMMKSGDVVVMDVGAEVDGYAADITRTFPVSGRFTPEQRKVYAAVLEAQQAAFSTIRPGVSFAEVENAVQHAYDRLGFGKYRQHGASHHLGLDVHDVGAMDTVRVGMVFTVEPGLYVPASDTSASAGYRGWGIRIEDDVLVTETGCVVLSERIPRTLKDIEGLMSKSRSRKN